MARGKMLRTEFEETLVELDALKKASASGEVTDAESRKRTLTQTVKRIMNELEQLKKARPTSAGASAQAEVKKPAPPSSQFLPEAVATERQAKIDAVSDYLHVIPVSSLVLELLSNTSPELSPSK